MKSESENYFDEMAAKWDESPNRRELASKVADFIHENAVLSRNTWLMEYGCGTGMLSILLSRHVKEILAADSSDGMIGQLKTKLSALPDSNIKAVLLDLAKDHPPKKKFDMIVSSMTLHHVDEALPLLEKLIELLSPSGQLAIADLDEEDGSFHDQIKVPHHGFSTDRICETIVNCGLSIGASRIIHGIARNGREYPIFAVYARRLGK